MRPLFSRVCTSFSQSLLSRRGAERSHPNRGKERRQPLRLQVGMGALAAATALGRNGSAAVRRPLPLHSYWNGASRTAWLMAMLCAPDAVVAAATAGRRLVLQLAALLSTSSSYSPPARSAWPHYYKNNLKECHKFFLGAYQSLNRC